MSSGNTEIRKVSLRNAEYINHLNNLTSEVIKYAIEVHKVLGPGLLESAYQECLVYELKNSGLNIKAQLPLPIIYKTKHLDHGYRIDILVEDLVVLELKTVDHILEIHKAQLLTYLKFGGYNLGLLINFNSLLLKDGISRIILT